MTEIDPRPGKVFDDIVELAMYQDVELIVGHCTAEQKRDLVAALNGVKTSENTLVILRGDDSQSPRHGGIRQYRSFEAYVNAVKVETWRDDQARHNYATDEYLNNLIDEWGKVWSRALGCPVVRGELRGRVRLIQERKR